MVKRKHDIFVTITFITILFLPFVESGFHFIPEKEIKEKRALKEMPELDISLIYDYPEGYDSSLIEEFPDEFDEYYRDHFELRNQFIYFNSWLKFQVFSVPPINKKAFFGNDGWMYILRDYLGVYLGNNIADDDKLKEYYEIFNYRQKFLDSLDIKYYVVIAPTKSTIYPEYLPESKQIPRNKSITDQFVKLLDTINGLTLIDLRKDLINAKDNIRLFNKTDTHWNAYGSFIAYESIMNAISKDYPELQPNKISEYMIDTIVVDGMNISRMMGIYNGTYENKITCDPVFKKKSMKGKKTKLSCTKMVFFKI